MIGSQSGDQKRALSLPMSALVWSMKWVVIVFPATIIAIVLIPMFAPNTLSALPEWEVPAIAVIAPFALGLISAFWQRRRGGTVSAAIEPQTDRPMWLLSAVANRWLYLIVVPVFIIIIVLLRRVGVVAPLQLVSAAGIGAALLLLGLRLVEGIRRLR